MKRLVIALLFAACLSAAAEAPHEAPPHEGAQSHNEIWWKWANFAILAAGLGFLIGKNAGPFFRSRSEDIQRGIREAAAVRAEAEAKAAEIEKRISNLNAEVEALRKSSQEEIAREGERVSAETAQQIAKIQRQAEADIASAAKIASQQLKAYSAELAVKLAAQQIEQRMTQQNQEQLADTFVDDIRRKASLN